jgi:hypothetical protein
LKTNGLYAKEEKTFKDRHRTYATHSVKQIAYSTDPRDFGQVAKSIPCQEACPAKTNIPGYIRCIHDQRYSRAYELNRKATSFPGSWDASVPGPAKPPAGMVNRTTGTVWGSVI